MQPIVPIFSGGGTRLPAHIGILQALHDLKISFDTIVGVSGGSIVAALFASGYQLEDIYKLARDTNFKQFREFNLLRLIFQGGLASGERFESWMDKQLHGKLFGDLDMDLNILATDINGGGPVVFNRTLTPEIKVSKAIRYSMSIPLIFSFQIYKQHVMVDGAILAEDALFEDWRGDGTPSVCFRLKSELRERPFDSKSRLMLPQYVGLLIRTFMTALSREYVHADYWHNTLVINTGDASAVDFDMTEEQKEQLYNAGYNTVFEYLPTKLPKAKRV
ncbi:patatin-like phospholipase family protein [Alteromonas facilis]|uniref:patatin-like phospholipase family protein n=1 Tax=Alteromonas facilis TaxID=2048004 RepID=UPI000C286B43|nr:patatin-like phospholipase family protein [Alteromonas facilis]